MSVSLNENREYFVKALNEVINRKTEEEMAGCQETAHTSLRHKIIMKRIAKGKCYDAADKVIITKRTMLIAIIAAILALTSCTLAIIYRDNIAGFIEKVYEEFVYISPDDESRERKVDYPETIERVYEFTYIPEGYELKKENSNLLSIARIYKNSEGKIFLLKQQVIDSADFKTDSVDSFSSAFNVGDIAVYYRINKLNNYVWESNGYQFQIHSKDELSAEELQKLISGIK